jgi:hypothetical protein
VIKGKVEGIEKLDGIIQRVTARLFSETKKILFAEAAVLTTHIKNEHLKGGTSATRLAVRSANLISSTRALPVKESPGLIESGVGFGTQYARTHIGPKGQVTTIRAKKGKFLAIPLMAARTPGGDARGGPRSGMWGETFFARSKKGNLILFGKKVVQKGKSAGQTRGDVVPLFVLKTEVKVKARVHPETILAWEKPKMIAAFQKIGVNLRG